MRWSSVSGYPHSHRWLPWPDVICCLVRVHVPAHAAVRKAPYSRSLSRVRGHCRCRLSSVASVPLCSRPPPW
eukprot:6725945-Pyramimonas_sp.AAC.1